MYLKRCSATHGLSAQVGGISLRVRLIMRILYMILVYGFVMRTLEGTRSVGSCHIRLQDKALTVLDFMNPRALEKSEELPELDESFAWRTAVSSSTEEQQEKGNE